MKTKVFLILFSFTVISVSASADNSGPNTDIVAINSASFFSSDISFLRTHRQGKGIEVSWGVTNSDGVSGFIVQRTYQDPNDPYSIWENVSSMSCNPSRSFKCNDENVFPGYICYRVWIVMTNGSKTVSPVSMVHIMSRHG